MYGKNIELKVVSVEQNRLESLIVFEMDNVSSIVKKKNVGQLIESDVFELNCVSSIGKCKWVVMLFLNGQYEYNGIPNEHICVYLKMINCENPSAISVDVKFQLGSEYAAITMNNQRICFHNVRDRWIGTKLLKIKEMIINGNRFIQDDTLVLSVHLNEHSSTRQLIPLENEYQRKRGSTDNTWTETSPSVHQASPRTHTSKQMSAATNYDTNHYNFLKDTLNIAGPSGAIGTHKPLTKTIPICDSNLNYLNGTSGGINLNKQLATNITPVCGNNNYLNNVIYNEYSDEEDNTREKATTSTGGLWGDLISGIQGGLRKLF